MPRKIGEQLQERISFTFTPINLKDSQKAMDDKEFTTVASLINTALRFYFENREKTSSVDDFKAWIVSDDGERFMKGIILKTREKK